MLVISFLNEFPHFTDFMFDMNFRNFPDSVTPQFKMNFHNSVNSHILMLQVSELKGSYVAYTIFGFLVSLAQPKPGVGNL